MKNLIDDNIIILKFITVGLIRGHLRGTTVKRFRGSPLIPLPIAWFFTAVGVMLVVMGTTNIIKS